MVHMLHILFIIVFYIIQIESLICKSHYYTKCRFSDGGKCKPGYTNTKWVYNKCHVPGYMQSKCEIEFECLPTQRCGDPDTKECVDLNLCTSPSMTGIEFLSIKWLYDYAIHDHANETEIVFLENIQPHKESICPTSEKGLDYSIEYIRSNTTSWTNNAGIPLDDGYNFQAGIPVIAKEKEHQISYSTSEHFTHVWGEITDDHTPLHTHTFHCKKNKNCKIIGTKAITEVPYSISFSEDVGGVPVICTNEGIWKGESIYNVRIVETNCYGVGETTAAEKNNDETVIDLTQPLWIGILIGGIIVLFVLMYSCVKVCCGGTKKHEDISLLGTSFMDGRPVANTQFTPTTFQ